MKMPILLKLDTPEIVPFDTPHKVEVFIEPYDVDEYRAFDAEGSIIDITLANKSFWSIGDIKLVSSEKRDSEALRQYILEYLREQRENPRGAEFLKQHPELNEEDLELKHLVALLVNWHREQQQTSQTGSFLFQFIQALFKLLTQRKH